MSTILHALCALALAVGLLLPVASGAAAKEPDRPVPGYRPTFVTEREAGPWEDCLWASAAMLVDKWTAGRMIVSKDRLRELSGDLTGGSNLAHLSLALDKIGIQARTSPNGGDDVTWTELRHRLAAGGGAILLGDGGDLPRWYGRWDPEFWAKTGDQDNHALYVDGYDRRTDRFWLMDPLAPAGWTGEWISGAALRRFAWATPSGGLSAVLTPPAQAAPFAGVELDDAIAFAGLDGLHVMLPVAAAPKGWTMPKLAVISTMTPAEGSVDPAVIAVGAPAARTAADVASAAVAPPAVHFGDEMLQLRVATPTKPGTYDVAIDLREQRFGRSVGAAALTLYVPGERRGTIASDEPTAPVEIGRMLVDTTIVNTGTVSWAEGLGLPGASSDPTTERRTRLVGTWLAADPKTAETAPAPAAVELGFLPLAPGEALRIHANLSTPTIPGRWILVLDLVDDVDGSFAAHGSKPSLITIDLVDATARGVVPH